MATTVYERENCDGALQARLIKDVGFCEEFHNRRTTTRKRTGTSCKLNPHSWRPLRNLNRRHDTLGRGEYHDHFPIPAHLRETKNTFRRTFSKGKVFKDKPFELSFCKCHKIGRPATKQRNKQKNRILLSRVIMLFSHTLPGAVYSLVM